MSEDEIMGVQPTSWEGHKRSKLYSPLAFAIGGEHAVYDIWTTSKYLEKLGLESEGDSYIAKVNLGHTIASYNKAARAYFESGNPEEESLGPGYDKVSVRNYARKLNGLYSEYSSYFPGHTPETYFRQMAVPVEPKNIRHVLESRNLESDYPDAKRYADEMMRKNPFKPSSINTIVTVQEKVDTEGGKLDCYSSYVENFISRPTDEYKKVTNRALFGKDTQQDTKTKIEDFLSVYPGFQYILLQSQNNLQLRSLLSEYVRSSIKYTNDTREIQDLTKGNMFFHKNDQGEWTYTLIDTFQNHDGMDMVATAQEILNRGSLKDDNERRIINNTTNYIRAIHGLADILEIDERIEGFDIKNSPDSIYNLIKKPKDK